MSALSVLKYLRCINPLIQIKRGTKNYSLPIYFDQNLAITDGTL